MVSVETLSIMPMSWIRLAAFCRYHSSRSNSSPVRRDGVFSSCSWEKSHFVEAPKNAITLSLPQRRAHGQCCCW